MATKSAKPRTARINLNVPFPAHKAAKAYGAYFDRKAKVWFTYAGDARAKNLVRFMAAADRKAYNL